MTKVNRNILTHAVYVNNKLHEYKLTCMANELIVSPVFKKHFKISVMFIS